MSAKKQCELSHVARYIYHTSNTVSKIEFDHLPSALKKPLKMFLLVHLKVKRGMRTNLITFHENNSNFEC